MFHLGYVTTGYKFCLKSCRSHEKPVYLWLRGSVKAKITYILISLEFAVKAGPGESYGLRCGQGYIYLATAALATSPQIPIQLRPNGFAAPAKFIQYS